MNTRLAVVLGSSALLAFAACKKKDPPPPPPPELSAIPATPKGLPELPPAPADNPTTLDKVILGRMLFFDDRLSVNNDEACKDCHMPAHAWSTPSPKSANGVGGHARRKSPSVLNSGYWTWPSWDGRASTLEEASRNALVDQLGGDPPKIAQKLAAVPGYGPLFQKAFGQPPSERNIVWALAAFLRTLRSGDSPFDRGELSESAQRGRKLFESLGCIGCHKGALFTDDDFHDVGVGVDKKGTDVDLGRSEITKKTEDDRHFRTPSLRDVALAAPYFHDGSVVKLDDAVRFMVKGGLPNVGIDPLLKPHEASDADIADLVAFLGSLSGTPTITAGPPGGLPSN